MPKSQQTTVSRSLLSYSQATERWFKQDRKESMSIEESMFHMIQRCILERNVKVSLEFGSGLSTFAFDAGRHGFIESDYQQFFDLQSMLPEATGYHAPLLYGWYSHIPRGRADLILVDGPHQGHRLLGARDILMCCHRKTIILVDDIHRQQEQELAVLLSTVMEADLICHGRWAMVLPH